MRELEIKKIEIELFGHKLFLFERKAKDVISMQALENELKNTDDPFLVSHMLATKTVSDSLQGNLENIKWWNFNKRRGLKKIIDRKYLLTNLTITDLFMLSKKVSELENQNLESLIDKNTERKNNEQ